MKKLLQTLIVIALVVSIGLFSTGCEKEEGPTGPPPGVGGYGSGTISYQSNQGNRTFGGSAVNPPSGQGVLAIYDTVSRSFMMFGYAQIAGSRFDFIVLIVQDSVGVRQGTYQIGQSAGFFAGLNVDTAAVNIESLMFWSTSGSIAVNAATGSTASGAFSGSAVRASDGQIMNVTSGSFSVSYVRGRNPFE